MDFDFHKVYHCLHNYCVTDLSAVYLDILKDRLYASSRTGVERRSAQTALWHILRLLLRDMAPVLSFTAEEILSHLPEGLRVPQATVFALPPLDDLDPFLLPDGVRDDWNVLLAVRGAVTRAIEPLRRDGVVGHALDTRVTLYVADELRSAWKAGYGPAGRVHRLPAGPAAAGRRAPGRLQRPGGVRPEH